MNAHEIVNLLLEADNPSAGDSSGVYIFGPHLHPEGHVAKSVEQAVIHLRHFGLIPKGTPNTVHMLDQLVDRGYTFIIKHHAGNVEVIGQNVPVRTTPEGMEKAIQLLGLEKHDKVAYRKYATGTVTQMNVEQVFQGSKELEQGQKASAEQAPDDPAAVPKQQQQPAPDPEVGDFQLLDAPLQIGVTFDRQSRDGIQVVEVHPSGPAAQAGIQAGDVITGTGEFVTNQSRIVGPYTTRNPKELEIVLGMASPQYPLPFRVQRGGQERWFPVQPKPSEKVQPKKADPLAGMRSTTGEQVNRVTGFNKFQPKEQTHQFADVEQQPAPPPTPTQYQGAKPKQTSMARQLFAGQRRPKQRRLNLKPNEPAPARETGYTGANVSSLT